RIYAHAHDPRRLAAARADAAEHVVRQAELVADDVARATREGIGGIDHVRHAHRGEARIRAWQTGPADDHVALRLVRYDLDAPFCRRYRDRRIVGSLCLGSFRPVP